MVAEIHQGGRSRYVSGNLTLPLVSLLEVLYSGDSLCSLSTLLLLAALEILK
jgi:hypothetical protein